jgi:hypothetical protein
MRLKNIQKVDKADVGEWSYRYGGEKTLFSRVVFTTP